MASVGANNPLRAYVASPATHFVLPPKTDSVIRERSGSVAHLNLADCQRTPISGESNTTREGWHDCRNSLARVPNLLAFP